jgi:3-hydroxyisobutyrate dehydrogenase-like beta-hydroxyacid dehydrogenase
MSAQTHRVGFIGLGDQGLPMAIAIAEAGFELHVWARRAASMDALGDTPHTRHDEVGDLGAACEIVGICVSTDEGVLAMAADQLLAAMAPTSVVVNHGTGLPRNAVRLAKLADNHGAVALDAPVSGGRPGAEQRRLTTLVGGPEDTVTRCRPVFDAFSAHVVHTGPTGTGQTAKLFNNALLMANQAAVADVVELAGHAGVDAARLVEGLKLGSATSAALTLFNTMVTPDTVGHLSQVEALDMELFSQAMKDAGVDAANLTSRGLSGAHRMPDVIAALNP